MNEEVRSIEMDRARYGLGLLIAFVLVTWLLAGPEDNSVLYLIVTDLLGGALILAVSWSARESDVGGRRFTWVAAAACAVAAVVVAIESGTVAKVMTAIVMLVVSLLVPVIAVHGLQRRRRIDIQLVMAAITIYLVLGLASTMALGVVGELQSTPLLVLGDHTGDGTFRDKVYFSFVTLATVGYGDITPFSGSARAVAILTAITGQLYLIVAVATAVTQLASARADRREAL